MTTGETIHQLRTGELVAYTNRDQSPEICFSHASAQIVWKALGEI